MRKITANIKRVVRTRGYFLRARRTRGYFLSAVLIRRAHGPKPSWFQLAECGLTMHPEKSKIVYCKDSNRTQLYPQVYFTFLGFTFQPRKALSKQRRIFTSFLPGVSKDALKRMRQTVRGWKLNRQTHGTLAALATQYNPIIQGWWNYYGAFYQTAMLHIYQHIDRALERWARRKYKALSGRKRGSGQWLRKMKGADPQLFHH